MPNRSSRVPMVAQPCPRTSMTEENEMLAAMTSVNILRKSTQRASQQLSIPRTSLRCIMDELNLKPFRQRLTHGLLEDDSDRRLQFGE